MSDDSGSNHTATEFSGNFADKKLLKKQGLFEKFLGKSKSKQNVEEEILTMVDAGEEDGIIESGTKQIIENLFDFNDTPASEIMTHRRDIDAVEDIMPISDIVQCAIDTGHSRIPVYHEDIDDIVGVLYVKDLLKYVCSEVPKNFKITNITRDVLYVPKAKPCSELFTEMTEQKIQLAIVMDEYGGTEGLITMEDLIESIFGNIQDEYDDEEEEIQQISENKFTVDGATPISDVSQLIDIEIDDEGCETVAGLILEKLGRIPEQGEHPSVKIDNIELTVQEIEDRRISKVLVIKTE
ncbi:MAG: hemolysin family protein [Bacillota bacterium]|nr:hemolysin family protein [Bacillota bacterium]